jgi:hypothetical protein
MSSVLETLDDDSESDSDSREHLAVSDTDSGAKEGEGEEEEEEDEGEDADEGGDDEQQGGAGSVGGVTTDEGGGVEDGHPAGAHTKYERRDLSDAPPFVVDPLNAYNKLQMRKVLTSAGCVYGQPVAKMGMDELYPAAFHHRAKMLVAGQYVEVRSRQNSSVRPGVFAAAHFSPNSHLRLTALVADNDGNIFGQYPLTDLTRVGGTMTSQDSNSWKLVQKSLREFVDKETPPAQQLERQLEAVKKLCPSKKRKRAPKPSLEPVKVVVDAGIVITRGKHAGTEGVVCAVGSRLIEVRPIAGGRYGKNIRVQRSSVKGHPEPGKLQERITAAARAGASDCDQFQIMEVTPPATKRPRASSYVASPQPDRKHESPGMSTEAKLRVATERAYAAGASHAANVITYANSTTSQQPLFQQPRLAPWSPPCNTFFGSPQLAPPGGLGSIYLQQLLQQRPDARAWYGDLL